jgi:hypothetical protein
VSTSGSYTGKLLTFNANTNRGASTETGTIAANTLDGLQGAIQMSLDANVASEPLPTTYPIDVVFGADGKRAH